MTLLLTKKTDDLPANFRYNRPENVPEVWKSTFTTPTGFMVATSERRTGKNKHSGKSYSSFQETKVEFFSMKSGVLNVYMKERNAVHTPDGRRNRSRMGSVRNSLNGFLRRYGYHGTNAEFYEAGARSLGYESMDALVNKEFPLRKDFRATIPGIGSLLRQDNLTSMSRSLLGKDFQKGIPRALAGPDGFRADEMRSQLLELTIIFQGIVPTDWIVDILEAREANRINRILHNREELRVIRRILRTASETQLRRLTRNPTGEFSGLFMDSIDQIDTFEGVEFRNLDELHDTVAPRLFRQKKLKPQDIELSKKAAKFVGEDDGFSVIAPGNTQDLYAWSSTMGNCISGYGAKAVQGHSQLFAVMQDDKMIANIELDAQGSIRQLLGQHNRSLEPELSSAVKDRVLSVWPKATVNSGWQ